MEILYRLTIAEMAERGVLDAYYRLYNLVGASPATLTVMLTQKQAEKIGLVKPEEVEAPKPKRTKKAKS